MVSVITPHMYEPTSAHSALGSLPQQLLPGVCGTPRFCLPAGALPAAGFT